MKTDSLFSLSTYDYPLDPGRIAQFPLGDRDRARLLVLHRATDPAPSGSAKKIEHRLFPDLVSYLGPGDLLVLNDTRVLPALLAARKIGGGGRVKVLLIRKASSEARGSGGAARWEALLQGKVTAGARLKAGEEVEIRLLEPLGDGRWLLEPVCDGDLLDHLDRVGSAPLPPYIRRDAVAADREDYQTVYARSSSATRESGGSVAAPTAGLHFTEALLEKVRAQGARLAFITLHIGPGTFRPVRTGDIRGHRMDPEYYEIPPETVRRIEETRASRGRLIAVGTSTTRALESALSGGRRSKDGLSGATDLFIHPGYRFQAVDGLVTNFHMPRSTLLMLVAAFAGLGAVKEAYAEAHREGYRFLSYGDAMLIR
jgi:S-adenosylmethionine:tRNA ribosyltransferase-isomerase